MSSKLDSAIFITLALTVVFTVAVHGVVEPWSHFLFVILILCLFLLWTAKAIQQRHLTIDIPHAIWPVAALFLVGLLQSLSWHDDLGMRKSLSIDVEATRGVTLTVGLLLLLSMISVNHVGNSPTALIRFLKIMIGFGAALGVLGMIQQFSGGRQIYWLRPAEGASFGPFFNRNHFAGYLEFLIPLPIAFIGAGLVRGEKLLLYAAAAIFMGTAVVFTLSRAGMISVVVELFLLAVMMNRRSRIFNVAKATRGRRMINENLVLLGVLAAILVSVFWFGAEPVINRVATGDPNHSDLSRAQTFESNRGEIWRDSIRMIRANFPFGVGLGAFPTAYPRYTKNPIAAGVVAEAHNDYLQILTDAGLAGGILVLWFLMILIRAVVAGFRTRDSFSAVVAMGGGAGLAGVLTHSMFDYNLHLPSHAALFLIFSTAITQPRSADNRVKEWSASNSIFSRTTREALS